jgi:hypothetical protein
VPASLVLLAGGMTGLAVAGPLDAIWHTAFGLDETAWSVPHSMLGTAMLVLALGAVAARLALAPHAPMRPWTLPLLALLLLFASLTLLGPLGNASPDVVQAMSRQGALATDADAQHVFRIYLEWNLTRTNPAFIVVRCRPGPAPPPSPAEPVVPRARVWFPLLFLFAVAARSRRHVTRRGSASVTIRLRDPVLPVQWAAVPVQLGRRPAVYPAALLVRSGRLVFGLVAKA